MPRKLKTSEVAAIRSEILAQQGGVCPLCASHIVEDGHRPALDHDHVQGFIRGVLCINCNGIEGRIRYAVYKAKRKLDNLTWLENLVAYLQKNSTDQTGLIHPSYRSPEEKAALAAKRKKAKKANALH